MFYYSYAALNFTEPELNKHYAKLMLACMIVL